MTTVLFTDLVGSTALATRLEPAVADRVREEHFATLRAAIGAHHGTEVKNLGDGLMVVFAGTSAALDCAEAMQQATVRASPVGERLSIRIGIAHGEVTEDAGDYFGDAVIEAARLCAAAEGGQILATQVVALAAGRRARQAVTPFGDLALKGIPEPVATVEVRWAAPDTAGSDAAVPLPRRCAAGPAAGFVGRVAERERITAAHKAVLADRDLHVVLLAGEAGIGKTSLATDAARAAHADGAIVLYGCVDEELRVPYGPWAAALTHLVDHAPPTLRTELDQHARSLARLAPALAPRPDQSPGEVADSTDAQTARYMLFSAVASALSAAAELAPVVLLLDDLHWADAPTLQLLRYLVTTAPPMPVLVIGTFRDAEVTAGSPLADLLAALHREPNVERMTLRGLDDLELLAFMEAAAGHSMDDDGVVLRDALATETDGNPFFVGEMLRHLAETGAIYQQDGRWATATDLRGLGLPASVVEVIGRRTARLSETAGRVLAIASVVGRDFDVRLLAGVAEIDEDQLLDVLDEAVDASLVEYVDGERCSFVHALIEHTLYESLAPARRARLHRLVAAALEDGAAGSTTGRAAELAHHWAKATTPADADRALHYAMAAGDEARQRLAPEEALRWYRSARSMLDDFDRDDERLRCRLLVGTGEAQRLVGDGGYRTTLLEGARLAERLGETELLVEAALANNRGFVSNAGVVDTERVEVLEAACRAVRGTESAPEARLLALLANELTYAGDLAARRRLGTQALAIARRLDDPPTLQAVLNDVTQAIRSPGTLDEVLALARESWSLEASTGDPLLRFWSATYLSVFLRERGDVEAGDEVHEIARSIARPLGQPLLEWVVAFNDACRSILAGELQVAEEQAMRAAELATATDQPDQLTFFGAQFSTIRILQGRYDEVVDLVRSVADENPGVPAFRAALAQIYAGLDRPDEIRSVLAPLAESGFRFPEDVAMLGALGQVSAAVAHIRWDEAAEVLYDLQLPYTGQLYYNGLACGADASLWLGVLADSLGRFAVADDHFARALATHERIGARLLAALTRAYWGRSLVSRHASADEATRGTELLRAAKATSETHGYGAVTTIIDPVLAERPWRRGGEEMDLR